MKRFDSINVIPFIDIMLVLLAIVLTTATFIAQGKLDIVLPVAESTTTVSDLIGVEIAIDAASNIYLNEESVSVDTLETRLSELDAATPVTLRVDKQTRFEGFISVVDLLKANKLDSVSILTVDG